MSPKVYLWSGTRQGYVCTCQSGRTSVNSIEVIHMRRTATVLTLLLVLTASAWSACPEAPAGCVYVGTKTVSTRSGDISATATAGKADITGEICVFRTSTGKLIYLVDESTVHYTDG